MRMSIVAFAVLGASAATAAAQNAQPDMSPAAHAGAVKEAVCSDACLAELQLTARAGGVPGADTLAIFTLETASETEQKRERAR